MKGDLDLIKGQLQDRVREVCERLLPDGKEESGQWVSFNPIEGDYLPGRLPALKIRMRGGVVGAWKDWRCGESGDVIKLVSYLNRTDTTGALVWARDFLGLRTMTRADRENMRRVEAQRKEKRERDDQAARIRKLKAANRLYVEHTAPIGAGSPAEHRARAYFAARCAPLDQVVNLNLETFRFAAATEWWKGAKWSNEGNRKFKSEPGPAFPAIHSAMRVWNGEITACHVTFLDLLKPKKAPVEPAKLMFGEALGAVIEISTGPTGQPFWRAEEAVPLIIAEGIETALSFAVTLPEARVWAGGSLAGIGNAPVNLPCVSWVLFARDNNVGNPQAQKQFEQALGRLEASGKRVVVEASHVGDDFNDLAQGEE
ncbi:hypothetical protein GGQ99_000978 [Aminobacter niigataensis]|uniref:Toprim domain-containing protein n=1 Tax=Aminobacter niigataensis TaxID=83265 RepID=A0ABR6KXJ7_9HYPH|nr:toprim domain-containing protein [Aminobacter niigataensis]MBB4649256.1 hypothetical protein [Aminobacter niigataensis]